MSKGMAFLSIIGLMCAIGLIATDIYIPVMPEIGMYFNADIHQMQATLTIYLIGLSVSQLVYGPLSDRFGRKRVVIFGMSLFTIGTFLCMTSTSIHMFIISRLLQAIGVCSGMTVGRAIIGDVYSKEEAAKVFTLIFPIVGLSPAIAPVIGSCIVSIGNWRSIFAVVLGLSIVLVILIVKLIPETKLESDRISISPNILVTQYKQLLKSKRFWSYALVPCFAYVGYFGYIAESPFIFNSFHYSSFDIGFFYMSLSISYLIGNKFAKKLLTSFSIDVVIIIGFIFFTFGALCFMVFQIIHIDSALSLIIPATILTFGNGFLLPLGTAGVVNSFPKIAGYASGLLGALQLGAASISTFMVGVVSYHSLDVFSAYMAFIATLGFALFVILSSIIPRFIGGYNAN